MSQEMTLESVERAEDGLIEVVAQANASLVERMGASVLDDLKSQYGYELGNPIPLPLIKEHGVSDMNAYIERRTVESLVPFAVTETNVIPAYPAVPSGFEKNTATGDITFAFTFAEKPVFELDSYEPVSITVRPFEVKEETIDKHLGQIALQFAKLEPSANTVVRSGDFIAIKVHATSEGEEFPNLCTDGKVFQIGLESMPRDFEIPIMGMKRNETKAYSFSIATGAYLEKTIDVEVTVLEILKMVVPDITDEWVAEYMPDAHDIEGLKGYIREEVVARSQAEYDEIKADACVKEVAKRYSPRFSDEIFSAQEDKLLQRILASLDQEGTSFEDYCEANGGRNGIAMILHMEARRTLEDDYALDAVYRHFNLSTTPSDRLAVARQFGTGNPQSVLDSMAAAGRMFAIEEAAERHAARAHLLEHATVTVEN